MSVKIGINGFGRIGRGICREIFKRDEDDIEISAINSSRSPEYLAYLLKYDSVHGIYPGVVTYNESSIIVDGHSIKILSSRDPSNIPWKTANVKYVFECTGVFNTTELAENHINRDDGAEFVILSAPPKDNTKMFVLGANSDKYSGEKIISCASCTTNCLAPLANVLNQKYGIESGLMTTVHAVTSSQVTVDSTSKAGKDWRGGRAANGNIIPSSTGAAKSVGKVLPELEGKLTGLSLRVPTLNVSVVDVTFNLISPITKQDFTEYIKNISESKQYKNIIGWTEEPLVSSDFNGNKCSCVIDLSASVFLNERFIKLVSWYDNEVGYSNRMIDLVKIMNNYSQV